MSSGLNKLTKIFIGFTVFSSCTFAGGTPIFHDGNIYIVERATGTLYLPDVFDDGHGNEISPFPLVSAQGIQIRGGNISGDTSLAFLREIANKHCEKGGFNFTPNGDQIDRYSGNENVVIIFGDCS